MRNFAHTGKRNPWRDRDWMLHVGRYPWRNHVCNFLWRSVKGFGRGNWSSFPFSHWLASSPLQHSRTTVRECCKGDEVASLKSGKFYCPIYKIDKITSLLVMSTSQFWHYQKLSQLIQEAQLMLTNLSYAFIGQSRSLNTVPFHILGTVSYCAIVTLSFRHAVFTIFDFKKCRDL